MSTPEAPGYYWFRGTGLVMENEYSDKSKHTEIHGIIQLDWWFDKVEPYLDGEYIVPETMNGIWSEKLISPFQGVEEPVKRAQAKEIIVSVDHTTLAIIQDMALNYFDESAGRHVLDWVHSISQPEEADE